MFILSSSNSVSLKVSKDCILECIFMKNMESNYVSILHYVETRKTSLLKRNKILLT